MIYCARSHTGNHRKRNEDSYHIPEDIAAKSLFVIADGMGGFSYGNAASRATVDAVVKTMQGESRALPVRMIFDAANAANILVRRIAQKVGRNTAMGSTLTLALVEGRQIYVGNVGDSRAYLLDAEKLCCITRDHTYVDELVRAGMITPGEARTHPQRHAITRAIGIRERVDIDVFEVQWEAGDVLLLCSDGLSNHVEDAQIERMLRNRGDLETVADALIETALDNGGEDNITVVLAQNTGPEKREVRA
ncbi:MAG: Stp1/IreP family PP2C-type Ser/Thr phosphatase [Bacillota bacterium]